MTNVWSDDDMIELRIAVCDGTSFFSTQVYAGYGAMENAVKELRRFKDHVHGGLYDLQFGGFGPEYANGAFHARMHFDHPGRLRITTRSQTGYYDFGRKNVAAEATMYVTSSQPLLEDLSKAFMRSA